MSTDDALKALLARYRRLARQAELRGNDDEAEKYGRRCDVVAGLLEFRHRRRCH